MFFSIGAIMTVITSFFGTTWYNYTIRPDPFGGYFDNWEILSTINATISMINLIFKLIGYVFLLLAWIQFSKCPSFSRKGKRSGKLMLSFSIIGLIVTVLSIFAQIYELYMYSVGWMSYDTGLFEIIGEICFIVWIFSVFTLPALFAIGYIFVGVRLRNIQRYWPY